MHVTGGAEPLRFVDVETEHDGTVTRHKMIDVRLIQETRKDHNFTTTSRDPRRCVHVFVC